MTITINIHAHSIYSIALHGISQQLCCDETPQHACLHAAQCCMEEELTGPYQSILAIQSGPRLQPQFDSAHAAHILQLGKRHTALDQVTSLATRLENTLLQRKPNKHAYQQQQQS